MKAIAIIEEDLHIILLTSQWWFNQAWDAVLGDVLYIHLNNVIN